jgi:hypothetical protein
VRHFVAFWRRQAATEAPPHASLARGVTRNAANASCPLAFRVRLG